MCRLDPVHERSFRDILSPSICGLVLLQLCIFKYILFAQNAQLASHSIRNLSSFSVSSARATVGYPMGHRGVSLAVVCQPPRSTCSAFSLILTKSFVLSLFLDMSHICSLTANVWELWLYMVDCVFYLQLQHLRGILYVTLVQNKVVEWMEQWVAKHFG